jgi:hypothetical protein
VAPPNQSTGESQQRASAEAIIAALIKAITGEEPRIRRKSEGAIEVICGREHLDGFKRYSELADAIEKWLEEARAPPMGRGWGIALTSWLTNRRGGGPQPEVLPPSSCRRLAGVPTRVSPPQKKNICPNQQETSGL